MSRLEIHRLCVDCQTHLQARHQIGSLEQSQCADLVDNLGDLGVGGSSRGCLGGFASPAAGCATGCEVCSGGRDAQGGRADGAGELSGAAGCDLGGEGHGGGEKGARSSRERGIGEKWWGLESRLVDIKTERKHSRKIWEWHVIYNASGILSIYQANKITHPSYT